MTWVPGTRICFIPNTGLLWFVSTTVVKRLKFLEKDLSENKNGDKFESLFRIRSTCIITIGVSYILQHRYSHIK